jgi:2'-5' RNA ligase
MGDLVEHYANLYKDAIQKIKSDTYQTDRLMDSVDNRSGLTLLTRPDIMVRNNIQLFLNELKAIEPDQYYYPDSDLHVTVLAIISCYVGFDLSQISILDYIDLINKSIASKKCFEIEFRGITASPSCIMIQGFLNDDTLNEIRDNLRRNFKDSDLQQSIDTRYLLQTAHSTVVRFRKQFTKKDDFVKVLEDYRDYYFGTVAINTLELVYTDWYQRKEKVKEVCRFAI